MSGEGLNHSGIWLSRVGQVFMKKNLTAPSQPSSRRVDSDDETGSGSTQIGSNDSFSNHIQAHVKGLSTEQGITEFVENSNTVEDLRKRLTFPLPLAQLINALRWDLHLYRIFPTLQGWTLKE